MVKCIVCNYEWESLPFNLLRHSNSCPVCNSKVVIKDINSIYKTNPNLSKLMLDINDSYIYTSNSTKRINWVCPNCKNIIFNKPIYQINNQGLSCPFCSDGVSYPEKFINNFLAQIGINFTTHIKFNWSDNKYYDVYIPDYNLIIEIMGKQHTEGCKGFYNLSGKDDRDVIKNDKYKMQLAIDNNINYCVIDAHTSTLEYMVRAIKNSNIGKYIFINYNNIDFNKIDRMSNKSNVVLASDLFNEGFNISNISNYLKVSKTTVRNYLKIATNLSLCDYNPKIRIRNLDIYNKVCVPVICITTNEMFNSQYEAANKYNINVYCIMQCCRNYNNHNKGKWKSAGKINGIKLKWKFANGEDDGK